MCCNTIQYTAQETKLYSELLKLDFNQLYLAKQCRVPQNKKTSWFLVFGLLIFIKYLSKKIMNNTLDDIVLQMILMQCNFIPNVIQCSSFVTVAQHHNFAISETPQHQHLGPPPPWSSGAVVVPLL